MKTIRTLAPALAAALCLSIGGVAVVYAQDAGAPPAAGAQDGRGHWDPAAMKQRWEARKAEHAKMLHDALNIRPDQEAAFQTFIASMDRHGEHGMGDHRMHGGAAGEHHDLTTPERLDRMQKRLAERDQRFEQHAAAVKTFYAALSPEQQRTFDALAKMHGRGGHGGHGRMGGHGGMMGRHDGPPPGEG